MEIKSNIALDLAAAGVALSERDIQYLGDKLAAEPTVQREQPAVKNLGWANGSTAYSHTGPVPITFGVFNGEKSIGSLGLPMDLQVDPQALRFRAYEAQLTNDVINIITGKFFKWVVGEGLKIQAIPSKKILKLEKIDVDPKDLIANIEEYFSLYAESYRSDYSGMDNLHLNAAKCYETAFIGGDALVILRVDEKNNVTSQVIDGQHIKMPTLNASQLTEIGTRGNKILNGIEIDKKGRHIAFWVRKMALESSPQTIPNYEFERIEAYGKDSGCLMAWMVYGKKARIDHHRGISMLSAILEKVTKLDRYTEATVATAEERAKVVYTVVHGKTSTGENPMITGPRARAGLVPAADGYAQRELAANQIALSENRKVFNMPQDSELKTVSSQAEIDYEPFWKAVFIQLCAAVDIPSEVALQMYNSNYSASRAAIKGWEFIINVYRKKFAKKFYQPFYDLWFYVHVLKGKVEAPGYLQSKTDGNDDVTEAYTRAKFTGANMPQIDPLKEANAIRAMLGVNDQTPLITHEDAMEQLGNGDWDANIDKIIEENEIIKKNNLNPQPPAPVAGAAKPNSTTTKPAKKNAANSKTEK